MPTPTRTPTVTPTPTPWPTLTRLPAAPPAIPLLGELAEPGVAWIQPVEYWQDSFGRQIDPLAWQQDGLLIVGGSWYAPIQAISIADGAPVWRYPAEMEYPIADRRIRDLHPIAVIDDLLVMLQNWYTLVAINVADGTTAWSLELRDRVSPAASGNTTLYLRDLSRYPSQLVALDAATGRERWRYDCLGDSDASVLEAPDGLFAICEDDAGLATIAQLSPQSGALLRLQPVPDSRTSLVGYEQGVLLFDTPTFDPSSYGNPPPADQQYLLTALDWATGSLRWQGYLADPRRAMVDEYGVVINVGSQLQRRSLRDGEAVWTTTLPVDDHGLWVSRAVRNDATLLIGSDSGVLYALNHPTGELLWMDDLWGMLGLPWRPVTPLAVEGDTVLVWMSVADGDAVAGLRLGATAIPWPTPTFLPASAFGLPSATATPVPTPGRTAVPADWTPEPVRWEPSDTTEIPDFEREMRDQLLTWLNLHPGDYDGFNRQVSRWPSRPYSGEGSFDFPPDYVSWVHPADLDGDGSQEDIVALGVRLKGWTVLKNEGQQTRVLYASDLSHDQLGSTLEFVLADDINCDGRVEIVLQRSGSGSWGDFIVASVHQWDGSTWRALGDVASSGYVSIRGREPSIEFVDTDGDGCLEAVGNYVPSHQAVTRPQTWTFAFRDGRYQRVDAVGVPSHLGYYKVIDVNRALARGDLDEALELATQALKDPETGMSSYQGAVDIDRYEARIAAYAAAEAMLVHALRGEADAMLPLLQEVETSRDRPDNPFLPAARALWETYADTGNALAACRAMEQVVRLWGDTELVQFGSERLEIEQICPLD